MYKQIKREHINKTPGIHCPNSQTHQFGSILFFIYTSANRILLKKILHILLLQFSVMSDSLQSHRLLYRSHQSLSLHGILQARILESVAIPFSRGDISWYVSLNRKTFSITTVILSSHHEKLKIIPKIKLLFLDCFFD